MPTPTYTALATVSFTADSSITFSSIPATYRDLVVVFSGVHSSSNTILRGYVNGDTGSNYSYVYMNGDGSSTASGSSGSETEAFFAAISTSQSIQTITYFDYSATDKHKTIIANGGVANFRRDVWANRWASTSAITSLEFHASTATLTGTLSLYGIEA